MGDGEREVQEGRDFENLCLRHKYGKKRENEREKHLIREEIFNVKASLFF